MNREQLQKEFFPIELMLKLFREETKLQDKIKLINAYIEEVRDSYDEDVLRIYQNNQIGFSYWMAEKFESAIIHFELVVDNMQAEDKPSLYFLTLNLLIRGNKLLSNYEDATKWSIHALDNSHFAAANYNLINLNEYVEILSETKGNFDDKYVLVIKSVIDFFGIPVELNAPIHTVKLIHKMHSFWAKKLTALEADFREEDVDFKLGEYEKYAASCELEWYRNYAKNTIEKLKTK